MTTRTRPAVLLVLGLCALALTMPAGAGAQLVRLPLGPLGSFAEARGVAVDQASGDLYAIDGRNEQQRIRISATAGKVKLGLGGEHREVSFEASAEAVRDALRELACGGEACLVVSGGPGDETGSKPYEVEFSGPLASTDLPPIECESGTPPLSGGSPSSACTVTTTVNGVNGQVARYHANGTPAEFSALGSNAIDGRGAGDETPQVGLRFSSLANEAQVAVDESGTATDGDIYVTQPKEHLLDVFAPTGAYLGQLTEYEETPGNPGTLKPLLEPCGVAVDGSGDLYLGDFSARIHKYAPSANPVANTDNSANFATLAEACTMALGAGPTAGFLFADTFGGKLFKLDATSGELKYEVSKGNTTAAVDPASGHVVTATGSEFKEFDASGPSSATLLHAQQAGSALKGVAINGSSGDLYLSRAGISHLDVYGPLVVVPDVQTKGSAAVTGTSATLKGAISAASGPSAECEFQYLPKATYEAQRKAAQEAHDSPIEEEEAAFAGAQAKACEPPGPFTGSSTTQVSAHVEGLAGETAYEFRLLGKNANGQIGSEAPESLTTLGKPLISATTATALSATEAQLAGRVDPHGLGSEVSAQYVTKAQFEASGFAEATTVAGPAVPAQAGGTGDLTSGSAEVVNLTTAAGAFAPGQAISGEGIPSGTTIAALGEGTLTLSKAATETHAAAALSASGPQPVAVRLSGLAPESEYRARLIAENEASEGAPTEGEDVPFATFGEYPPPPPVGPCPNDALRTEAGAKLPDCRAYEQVSPVDKHGANAIGNPNFSQAAADGHAAVFASFQTQQTTGGASHSPAYVASRGPGGWSFDGTLPLTEPGLEAGELGRDEELQTAVSTVKEAGEEGSLFATDLASFARAPLLAVPHWGHVRENPQFAADTANFIFEDTDALATGAVAGKPNLYELDHGALSLIGMVPAFPATSCEGGACVPASAGSFAGSYDATGSGNLEAGGISYRQHTISADGSEVFFTAAGTGRLFMRRNGSETVQVSAPQGATDPNGHKPAQWLASTPSGSKAFFASCEKLTPDSTAASTAANTCLTSAQGQDLYEYDTATEGLKDLTVDSNVSDPKGAQVQGLLGASPDGSYLYFAANGVLAPGATAGDCAGSGGGLSGECSIYLAHAGTITFVARVGANGANEKYADSDNWAPAPFFGEGGGYEKTARVSANGTLLFSSTLPLSGYANTSAEAESSCSPTHGAGPCAELYRYAPGDPAPSCVSCNPTGAPPRGNATLASSPKDGLGILQSGTNLAILTRNLSADGSRVFFETPDRLVGADVNGAGGCRRLAVNTVRACQDVYEWEAKGSGTCQSEAEDGGCLYLLSTGTSEEPSFFGDADEAGDNAFLFTYSGLVPQDKDSLSDLYDARVEGGIAAQHAVAPPGCEGQACRGPGTAAPPAQGAGSASFQGPGNPPAQKPCPKGKVRKGGRCVAKHHKHKKRHQKHKKKKHAAGHKGG